MQPLASSVEENIHVLSEHLPTSRIKEYRSLRKKEGRISATKKPKGYKTKGLEKRMLFTISCLKEAAKEKRQSLFKE